MQLALIAMIALALAFDYINGFHDAANSIATVVSTRVLSPGKAVVWAAFFNFAAAFGFGTAVAKALHLLPTLKRSREILDLCIEINRLENEADRIHQGAVRLLFQEERDPIVIIKWKEVLDFLEEATDRCEDVANVLEGVVVKHG